MAVLKRAEIAAPADLKREVVPVAALGGDVVVLELGLSDRLDFEAAQRELAGAPAQPAEAALPRARGKAGSLMVAQLLALSVVDADDEPIFDVKQWQAFGARNRDVTIELFNAAFRLSGFDAADQKKGS